ncbi:MAG: SprB repeat-containing protein [Bacteroidota bacterium]
MKSCLRVFGIACMLQFLVAEVSSQCNPAPIINFVNPSFEGTPQAHVTPGPWSICQSGQTPDTQPGSWGITMPPTNGSSYLGLVHQASTGWQEGASEQLSTPFIAGTGYNFTIDLANVLTSDPGIGIDPGCAELRIWGGYGACDRNTLLWSSGNITPWDTWVTYTVGFTPTQNFSWVLFEINSLGCTDGPYILVDNIGSVTPTPPTPVPTAIAATCFGFNTGSAYIGYTGGQAPYSFQWSNGPTTQNNSNLFAGTYGVTITDANQCTASTSVVITEPAAIIANVTTVDASCGASNGSATANITSGSGPFSY